MIEERHWTARAAGYALLLYVFLLGFLRPSFRLLGFDVGAADIFYPLMVLLWGAALVTGAVRLRWHKAYWLLAIYMAAMIASALVSEDSARSGAKLLTQVYLLSLPVIACSLVENERDLRRFFLAWLAATAAIGLIAAASLAAFKFDPSNPLLNFTRNGYGTLPPDAHYIRLRLTFFSPSLLCNYLSVSLAILLIAGRLGWISRPAWALLLAGTGLGLVVTVTPGLGAILLLAGIWLWLLNREGPRWFARLSLAAGIVASALFVLSAALTPILHPTAPFLIAVPGTDYVLAPAVRMMVWMSDLRSIAAHPLLGLGIGAPPADVTYLNPSDALVHVTDAHNTFLSVAAQCGLIGLLALLAILAFVVRTIRPFRLEPDGGNLIVLMLGFAFLNGIAYQGLTSSFEDARHLWLLFGFILAADRWRKAPEAGAASRSAARRE